MATIRSNSAGQLGPYLRAAGVGSGDLLAPSCMRALSEGAGGRVMSSAMEERVERRPWDSDLKSDAAVVKRAGLDEGVHAGAANLEPLSHLGGREPWLYAPPGPRHGRAKRCRSVCDRCFCMRSGLRPVTNGIHGMTLCRTRCHAM